MSEPQETQNENGATTAPEEIQSQTPPQDDAPPVKRRRGRPPKNPEMQKEGVSGTAPKRGRPPKSKEKHSYTPEEISVLGRQIVGIHAMVAGITKIPEAAIGDDEGSMMAQAIVNMADQYDLELDGKTGAALQLFATAAMIYAPRVIHFKNRMRNQPPAPTTEGNG